LISLGVFKKRFNYFIFFDYFANIPFFQWCWDCAKCQWWPKDLFSILLRVASRHGDFSDFRDFFAFFSSLQDTVCCFSNFFKNYTNSLDSVTSCYWDPLSNVEFTTFPLLFIASLFCFFTFWLFISLDWICTQTHI
jgi:hypothetical protein